ncbi:hypothetical protein FB446DRAFT_699769 [Lentinula raphanica]|nr:hypothetical protein FB446DRAFT_699769 [Lentinula raphanica]
MDSNSQHNADSVASIEPIETQQNQPPASPDGWGDSGESSGGCGQVDGFGYRDGWGLTVPWMHTNRECHTSDSTALHNLRVDFNNAGLTFEGEQRRRTDLDDLETKPWASVQSYLSSEEARKASSPYPTFTGRQVIQRLEEIQAQLMSRIHDHDSLVKKIFETLSTLSALQARERQISSEIDTLHNTQRELEGLSEISYALSTCNVQPSNDPLSKSIIENWHRELATEPHLTMSNTQNVQGRRKFDVSLSKLTRPGVQFYDFKTYKPPNMLPKTAQESQIEEKVLTPQQEARRRYEERSLIKLYVETESDDVKKLVKEWQSEGQIITKKNEKSRNRMKNFIVKGRYLRVFTKIHREERRYQEDRRRCLRYIENHGAKSFHHYLRRRNGHLQRPEDYPVVQPASN